MHLEILEVLRASKCFQDFDDSALRDFVVNLTVHVVPVPESVDPQHYGMRERLSVIFKGRLIFAITGAATADEVIYELVPGDVIGVVTPLGGLRNAPHLQAAADTTIIGISWATIDQHLEKNPAARKTLDNSLWRSSRRAQLAVHLNRFFGEVNATALTDFESMIEWELLSPGATLFRQGDPSDSVFFVLSGLLRVALEETGQGERLINEIQAGETIGEIAFLTEANRSATVYAVRDTVLARLSYPSFNKLMDKYPVAMKHIARLVSKRLQRQAVRVDYGVPKSTIIGVVSANPECPLGEVTRHLVEALAPLGSALHLDSGKVDREFGRQAIAQVSEYDPANLRLAQWLHVQEAQHQFVIYEADRTWSPWTQRAIRYADQVVVVATSDSNPDPGPTEQKMDGFWVTGRAPRRSLVLIHPPGTSEPHGTLHWLEPRSIDRHFHVRADSAADYGRVARILAGKGIALVLGGGGARGYAHIGLVRALEETGIPIDVVGGTSMGAILGALVAMQYKSQRIHATCKQYITGSFDYTLPVASLIKGGDVRSSLEAVFGERRIEDLWLPYYCVATNLTQADQVVHRRGSAASAIRSSMSLPGVLLPCFYNGDLLVDGGLVNNLPVDVMRAAFKRSKVIAVDVEPKRDLAVKTAFATEMSGWTLMLNRLNPFKRPSEVPSIIQVLIRSATLASVYRSNRLLEQDPPDLYLHIPVQDWGTLAFDAIDDIVTCGYVASLGKLKTWLNENRDLPAFSGSG